MSIYWSDYTDKSDSRASTGWSAVQISSGFTHTIPHPTEITQYELSCTESYLCSLYTWWLDCCVGGVWCRSSASCTDWGVGSKVVTGLLYSECRSTCVIQMLLFSRTRCLSSRLSFRACSAFFAVLKIFHFIRKIYKALGNRNKYVTSKRTSIT